MNENKLGLTKNQLTGFKLNGYLIVENWLTGKSLEDMQKTALENFKHPCEPWELEAQLGYPGAPEHTSQEGGLTTRRLLGAYQREERWQNFATSKKIKNCLTQLFAHPDIVLSQAHHNCLMTKTPDYSSDTGWHQDSRYWNFEKNLLISAWLALGKETSENGCLRIIPGSHQLSLAPERFDENAFFTTNNPENKKLINSSQDLELNPGDLVFFHCNLLHCASRNLTDTTKLSLVFTYHSGDNNPKPNSRSTSQVEIPL